jgi:hypothetical protein
LRGASPKQDPDHADLDDAHEIDQVERVDPSARETIEQEGLEPSQHEHSRRECDGRSTDTATGRDNSG